MSRKLISRPTGSFLSSVFEVQTIFFHPKVCKGKKDTKNIIFFFPKHFHSRGFNFHLMNGGFYVGKVFQAPVLLTQHTHCALQVEEQNA